MAIEIIHKTNLGHLCDEELHALWNKTHTLAQASEPSYALQIIKNTKKSLQKEFEKRKLPLPIAPSP